MNISISCDNDNIEEISIKFSGEGGSNTHENSSSWTTWVNKDESSSSKEKTGKFNRTYENTDKISTDTKPVDNTPLKVPETDGRKDSVDESFSQQEF